MPVTSSECQGLEADLEVPPRPRGKGMMRWGLWVSCSICLSQLLGANCWVFEMRKSTAVCEEVSKQVDPAEVWIRLSIPCKT